MSDKDPKELKPEKTVKNVSKTLQSVVGGKRE